MSYRSIGDRSRNRYRESYLSQQRRYRRKRLGIGALVAIVIFLCVVGAFAFGGAYAATEGHQICQVDTNPGKDRSTDKNGNSVYRVYTSCGVFSVADDPFRGRFNSADTYASIHPGATYEFHTIGWRNGFLSQFPNILDAKQAGHE